MKKDYDNLSKAKKFLQKKKGVDIDQLIRQNREKYSYLDHGKRNKEALTQMRTDFSNSKQQLTANASAEKLNLPAIHHQRGSKSVALSSSRP